ncbi:hypothetical protein CCUG60884_04543 [Mycobacteroides salmoniphilum]|uniref:Uncharacterized protein n=1 Tax=Mycobacteroides salmoniphilum TaxID=404941 RepID=A0A4R8SNV2_9MYCO|nr:hypothetical protein CCUG60884_04543 [Mycobacteroides salmoniphilum]
MDVATDGAQLATELYQAYEGAAVLDPVPAKSRARLRPALLNDYWGRSDTPYDREFSFAPTTMTMTSMALTLSASTSGSDVHFNGSSVKVTSTPPTVIVT